MTCPSSDLETVMIEVTFLVNDGREIVVQGDEGLSVMALALNHNVPGLDGDCGGCMSCGTCHAYIEPKFLATLDPIAEDEQAMLAHVSNPKPESRLTCQIRLKPGMQGLRLSVPSYETF